MYLLKSESFWERIAAGIIVAVIGAAFILLARGSWQFVDVRQPIPKGAVMPYMGNDNPPGWKPCMGMNGRILIGSDEVSEDAAKNRISYVAQTVSATVTARSGKEKRPHNHNFQLPVTRVRFLCKE